VDLSGTFTTVPEKLQRVLIRYPDVDSAKAALTADEIDTFYVLQPDYLTTGAVTQHIPSLSISLFNNEPIEQLLYQTLAAETPPEVLRRLSNPADFQEFNLERSTETAQDESADFALVYLFTILFIVALFATNAYLMQSIIEEKETRLIEILISSVTPLQLMTGKILALGIIGIFQIVVWMGYALLQFRLIGNMEAFSSLAALAQISVPAHLLAIMLVYFIFGDLIFAAVFAAVGALSNSVREGPQYAIIVLMPMILPFYAFSVFIETPNGTLPTILSIVPLTSPISMMMRLTITDVPASELLVSIGLLALFAMFMMWLSGRLFRVQSLLSGKVPKLRELWYIVRG
jgi:ABC-2 type transport system permease protein